MEIIKCTCGAVVKEISRLKKRLSNSSDKVKAVKALNNAEKIFSGHVDNNGIAIRCESDELNTLVTDYLDMLSKKHHLAICTFVEKGVSVYSVKQIERLKDYAVFSLTLPYNSTDDKIAIFVCYYDTYEGEMYDIDLISKRFCS